jgi:dihydroorotase
LETGVSYVYVTLRKITIFVINQIDYIFLKAIAMKKIFFLFLLTGFLMTGLIKAQTYNIIIKGGHVIDPKNNIDDVMDIAIKDGRISLIAKNIDPGEAVQVVNAEGLYVTPGLIDMHVHVFYGTNLDQQYMNGPSSVVPDGFTFRVGVTTVVDAGCAGWRTFPVFKRQTIDRSQTRVLAFLNIVGEGMRGNPFEQNLKDMDAQVTAKFASDNKSDIVGIKLAHYEGPDWTPTDRSVEAGKLANIPVMIDFGGSNPPLSIDELFMQHLRPGDIFTHCFAQLGNNRESIVDPQTGSVKPFVQEAVKRGIVFDVGYGGISFAFSQGIPAIKSGFYPQTISTDLHIGSMNGAMKDMLTTMSKFLAMGMDLQSVIKASTWTPAQVIKREELGNLSQGAEADVAVLNIRKGKFGFFDYTGYKIEADRKLECEMTIRAGKIVYDLNGIAKPVTLINR